MVRSISLWRALTLTIILLGVTLSQARAELNIEITQGVEGAMPIAIVPFAWEGISPLPPEDISGIVNADLRRSGRFAPLQEQDLLSRPHEGSQVNFKNWRILGIDNLVVGKMRPAGNGGYVIQFQLFDVFRGNQLLGFSIPVQANRLRAAGHHISDLIYEKLTGERGAFNTKVAYVVAKPVDGKPKYTLQIADADGYNPLAILTSDEPIMSPAWSPNGEQIAYVTFEKRRSEIFIQEIRTGQRYSVSSSRGINGAPAFSPDGTKLALTLSKRGNPDIHILDLKTKRLRQMTRSYAIDTEPAWSPDSQNLLFTSDRGGKPQIYRMPLAGGKPERITFEGDYNARARFSPDGNMITMVHRQQGRFHIAVQELDTGLVRVLTEGGLDESPSFAPNGRMVIYANEGQEHGALAAVSVDGRVHQRLGMQDGDVREPAWSPFSNN